MQVGKQKIGSGNSVYVVAEAGINHNGDINIAKKMIEAAAKAGADAIKFQTIFSEELFSKKLNPELYDLIKQWSFNKREHIELKKHAEKNGIDFFSTPVGKKSAKLLREIGVKCIKIASGELTNHELIKNVAKMKKPMIISTGMSTMSEIMDTVNLVRQENCPFALLHCNAAYPSPHEDVNLSNINYLQEMFDVPIGFSDHTIGDEACLAAVSMGASIIEKHFTLDKNMEGPDQKLSADVAEFTNLVSKIRIIEKLRGSPRTGPTKSEMKFRKLMRKSVCAATNIPHGTKLKKPMLTLVRPGTGIPPTMLDQLIGMTIKKDIKKGTLIDWKMF